jgi:uncharacterized membrane protein YesL
LRDWWRDLLILSLAGFAWAALSITVIGGPPAGAALFSTARSAILHENPDIRLFITSLRAYFARSWALGIVGLLGVAILLFDINAYSNALAGTGLIGLVGTVFLAYLGIVWLETIFYAWALMISRDDLKLSQLLRNGLLISLRFSVHNLVCLLFVGILFVAALFIQVLFIFVIPPLVALLSFHSLYMLAPILVPEDAEAFDIVG